MTRRILTRLGTRNGLLTMAVLVVLGAGVFATVLKR